MTRNQNTSQTPADQQAGLTDEQILGLDPTRDSDSQVDPEVDLDAANIELELHRHGELAGRTRRDSTGPGQWRKKPPSEGGVGWINPDIGEPPPGIAEQKLSREVLAQLRLSSIPGVGPRTMMLLLERFGSACGVFACSSEDFQAIPGVGPKLFQQIKLESRNYDLDAVVHWCEQHATEILVRGAKNYPGMLADLCDAPPVLFSRGEILQEDELAVAIVGTRHATPYGLRQAERFGYSLARAGVTVISGLARGVDAAAHEGALNAGGRTLAVLGGGLANLYPAEHEALAKAIAADGAVISEHPPRMKVRGGLFPQRNRIVAGLALATLVIEAPQRSGALITARLAGEQNREVMALPGQVTSRASRGTHDLIRDGATLVQTVDDVLAELGPMRSPVKTSQGTEVRSPSELKLNEMERGVLDAIGAENTSINQVIQTTRMPAHRVIAIISVLEMRRMVQRSSGQNVRRV